MSYVQSNSAPAPIKIQMNGMTPRVRSFATGLSRRQVRAWSAMPGESGSRTVTGSSSRRAWVASTTDRRPIAGRHHVVTTTTRSVTTTDGSAHRERTAVASRHHRDTVLAIFDDGGSFSNIETAERPTQCPLCPCPAQPVDATQALNLSAGVFIIARSNVVIRLADEPLCSDRLASEPTSRCNSESTVSAGHWCSRSTRAATGFAERRIQRRPTGYFFFPSASNCLRNATRSLVFARP